MAVADDVARAALAVIAAAMRHEERADFVEIEAPLVAAADGEELELVADGMIAPDASADLFSLIVGRAGLADERVREDAVAAVEPAVGAPGETSSTPPPATTAAKAAPANPARPPSTAAIHTSAR